MIEKICRHNDKSETEERNISENLKATIASNYVRISILIYIIIVVVVIVIRRTLQLVRANRREKTLCRLLLWCVCVCAFAIAFFCSHMRIMTRPLYARKINMCSRMNWAPLLFRWFHEWVPTTATNIQCIAAPISFNHICPSPPHISTNTHKRTVCSSKTTSNGKLCPREVCSSANYVERNNLHKRTWKKQRYTPPIVRWSPTTNTHKPVAATTTRTQEKTFPFVVVLHLNFPSCRSLPSDSVFILDFFFFKEIN